MEIKMEMGKIINSQGVQIRGPERTLLWSRCVTGLPEAGSWHLFPIGFLKSQVPQERSEANRLENCILLNQDQNQ